eukprot:GFYU01006868.1.p1 GENE.GFYU01006868.1~~GFYU01006868.1.p1  ORF type:complete len:833 (-),score=175.05 GFYU01006868.1:45-2543(-)
MTSRAKTNGHRPKSGQSPRVDQRKGSNDSVGKIEKKNGKSLPSPDDNEILFGIKVKSINRKILNELEEQSASEGNHTPRSPTIISPKPTDEECKALYHKVQEANVPKTQWEDFISSEIQNSIEDVDPTATTQPVHGDDEYVTVDNQAYTMPGNSGTRGSRSDANGIDGDNGDKGDGTVASRELLEKLRLEEEDRLGDDAGRGDRDVSYVADMTAVEPSMRRRLSGRTKRVTPENDCTATNGTADNTAALGSGSGRTVTIAAGPGGSGRRHWSDCEDDTENATTAEFFTDDEEGDGENVGMDVTAAAAYNSLKLKLPESVQGRVLERAISEDSDRDRTTSNGDIEGKTDSFLVLDNQGILLSPLSARHRPWGSQLRAQWSAFSKDVQDHLLEGQVMIKHGRWGKPHEKRISISEDLTAVQWQDVTGESKPKRMSFSDIHDTQRGATTPILMKTISPDTQESNSCIALLGSKRGLNLQCHSDEVAIFWYFHLKKLVDASVLDGEAEYNRQLRLERESQIVNAKKEWEEKVMPNFPSMLKRRTSKLKGIWHKGVPPNLRSKVWLQAIGNQLQVTPDLYAAFRQRAEVTYEMEIESGGGSAQAGADGADGGDRRPVTVMSGRESSIALVSADLPRTFPHLSFFHKGGTLEQPLRNILQAYCFYRPDVGYVQGMSFLAAMLLLYMDEYEAFQCLANLLQSNHFLSFFRMDMGQIGKRFRIYDTLFEDVLPAIHKHFTSMTITPDMYLLDWLMTLYAKALPLDLATRIWDSYLLDGEIFLFRTAFGIFRMHEKQLLSWNFEECLKFLNHLPQTMPEKAVIENILSVSISEAKFASLMA